MKTFLASIFIFTLVSMTGIVTAEEKAYVAKENEEICGTWINLGYKTGDPPQKQVYKSDGTIDCSIYAESGIVVWQHGYSLTTKWKDSEGNIWYKSRRLSSGGEELYQLNKINKIGTTLEYQFAKDKYPTVLDPKHDYYRKYYRK